MTGAKCISRSKPSTGYCRYCKSARYRWGLNLWPVMSQANNQQLFQGLLGDWQAGKASIHMAYILFQTQPKTATRAFKLPASCWCCFGALTISIAEHCMLPVLHPQLLTVAFTASITNVHAITTLSETYCYFACSILTQTVNCIEKQLVLTEDTKHVYRTWDFALLTLS